MARVVAFLFLILVVLTAIYGFTLFLYVKLWTSV